MLVFCLIDDGSLGSWEDATLDASLQALVVTDHVTHSAYVIP